MNNLKAERTLTAFDAWFNEQEGYSLRSERFEGDVEWLKAAFEAGALSTQQPMGEVRVKALEWRKSEIIGCNGDWHTVPTAYSIRCADENGWKWSGFGGFGYAGSDEAAKAAAQCDYERRILSALHLNQESGE